MTTITPETSVFGLKKLDVYERDEWVERLRDPETKQGVGKLCSLRREYGGDIVAEFCCLGVYACTIAEETRVDRGTYRSFQDFGTPARVQFLVRSSDGFECWNGGLIDSLPMDHPLQQHVTMPQEDNPSSYEQITIQSLLAKWNDSGTSFIQIADFIERNL
jgi:hypothetical protein